MNLIQRLSNIWKLSALNTEIPKHLQDASDIKNKPIHLAQIIKMHDTEKIINDLIKDK